MLRFVIITLLLTEASLVNGQETGLGLGTCTYSFVVQSPYCGKDLGADAQADILRLQGTVDDLRQQMRTLAVDISAIKRQPHYSGSVAVTTESVSGSLTQGHTYVFMGCPRIVSSNVVYLVTTSIEPSYTDIISFNESALIQGKRLLIEPTLPPFPVFCTLDRYIVFQRRQAPFNLQFNRTWYQYKHGFGDVSGEMWLGLENLYRITNQPYLKFAIRFEMKLTTGALHYAEYDNFVLGNEINLYKIASIGTKIASSITLYKFVTGVFATYDKDTSSKCASVYNGFWYMSTPCSYSQYNSNKPVWYGTTAALEWIEIKIRPVEI